MSTDYSRALELREAQARGSKPQPSSRRERLRYADSYSRMRALLNLFQARDFWTLVGREWSGCDNIFAYAWRVDELIERKRHLFGLPITEAMCEEAQALYLKLPSQVTVWRGCYEHNINGLSWSLDRGVAARFPSLNRYWQPDMKPLLIEGHVSKQDIAFLLTDRKEAEVVLPLSTVEVVSRIELEVRSLHGPSSTSWAPEGLA
ncbi:MAG TPA: hypothetical protein VLQ46_10495 [Casimicrobiaceae bacterium]|nr:hypothetical protein [Casimicrobiaceae bacterium]